MSALLESPPRSPSKSVADLAAISRQLAEEVGRMRLQSEGFSVDDYLALDGNYFVEFVNGCLQVLPMPSGVHQDLIGDLYLRLKNWAKRDPTSWVRFAPFRVRVTEGTFREPDVCFSRGVHASLRHANFWDRADFVIEIISDSNREHDTVTKRAEYAAAGIPEYWLVDPEPRTITVLVLRDGLYVAAGEYGPGQVAASVGLVGFAVDVDELFAAVEPPVG